MSKKSDLIGKRFGRLIVVSEAKPEFYSSHGKRNKHRRWNCVCDCKNTATVSQLNLRVAKSCGCQRREKSKINGQNSTKDLTNKRFGRLFVLSKSLNRIRGRPSWLVRCDCGKEKIVCSELLLKGVTRSCGCWISELATKRMTGRTGKNNFNWNPLLTAQERIFRRKLTEWNKVQPLVKKRDKYTCAICGRIGGVLHVHHLFAWKEFPKKRFDLNNLITLCSECHHEVHQIKRLSA